MFLKVFVKLGNLLRPFRRQFIVFALLILVYEGLQMLNSYWMPLAIRIYDESLGINAWVIFGVAFLVYTEVFARLDNFVDWYIITKIGYPIYNHLHTGAFHKFLTLDLKWHQKRNSGALIGKVNNGIDKAGDLVDAISWEFFPTLVQLLMTIVVLVFISWEISLISIPLFMLFIYISIESRRARKPMRTIRHDHYEEMWHHSIQYVQGISTVFMSGQDRRVDDEYQKIHKGIRECGTEEARIAVYVYNRKRIRLLSYFGRTIVLLVVVMRLYSGTLSIADVIFVWTLTERLFHSFWRFARLYDRADEASEGVGRLVDIMDQEPTFTSTGTETQVDEYPVAIGFQDVCFSYNGGYNEETGVLHNVSFDIEPGSVVAIVGPSGAGKTTIQKLVSRLFATDSGRIVVGGTEVSEWDEPALRRLFSHVPQGDSVAIFSATLMENIRFAMPDASDDKVYEAARLAGVSEFAVELENGYETQVGERGVRLSGGQKQRVALARAILADRPIIFFDEATSAVDAITEHEIQQNMKEILKGKTAIIIAHRLSTVWGIAKKIIVMQDGRIVEEGTHDELMHNHNLYAEMANLQQYAH